MSKNLKSLLEKLGVENVDTVAAEILSDSENANVIDTVLKASQSYSRPFIETELTDRFKSERNQFKGRYLKEALGKINKVWGTPLTNKEIEEVLNDPENTGQTFDKAIELLKTKVSEKNGTSETDLQKMLDAANAKIQDFETRIPQIEQDAERKINERIQQFRLDGIVDNELVRILEGKTVMPATKAAKLIKGQLSERALLRLKDDKQVALYKLGNPEEHLKKNETTLHTLDSLVDEIITDLEIPTKKSGGTRIESIPPAGGGDDKPKTGATGLAAKMSQVPTI